MARTASSVPMRGEPWVGVSPGRVDVFGRPAAVTPRTAEAPTASATACRCRGPATQARTTVVVATPLASVVVGVLLILSAADGEDVKDQSTAWPEIGFPAESTIVAVTVMLTPHWRVPPGVAMVTAAATWAA